MSLVNMWLRQDLSVGVKMLSEFLSSITSNLDGVFEGQVESGNVTIGFTSGVCTLSDFSVKVVCYEAESHLLTLVLTRGFPIIKENANWVVDYELEREDVELSLKYCLLRNSLLSASVEVNTNAQISAISGVKSNDLSL